MHPRPPKKVNRPNRGRSKRHKNAVNPRTVRQARKPVMPVPYFLEMDRLLSSYGIGFLQDVRTVSVWLEQNGRTFDDLWKYLDDLPQRDQVIEQELMRKDCPVCGAEDKYWIHSICSEQGPGNMNGYRHQWYCDSCGHYEYGVESLKEVLQVELKERYDADVR